MQTNNFILIDKGNKSQVFLYADNLVLKMVNVNFPKERGHLRNEFDILTHCDHKNILKVIKLKEKVLINEISDPNSDCRRDVLMMEFANRGSLRKVLKAGVDLEKKKVLMLQMVQGLRYLHVQQKVAHRDIKLENVLVREDSNGELTTLISDFGFALKNSISTQIRQSRVQRSTSLNSLQTSETSEVLNTSEINPCEALNSSFLAHSYKGTEIGYMAPQIRQLHQIRKPYNPIKADIFSFGVLLFAFFFNRLPFEASSEENPFYNLIVKSKFCEFWTRHKILQSDYSELNLKSLQALLERMFSPLPENRPSIEEVIESDFIKSIQSQINIVNKLKSGPKKTKKINKNLQKRENTTTYDQYIS